MESEIRKECGLKIFLGGEEREKKKRRRANADR
jgi:hypothetical protein